MEFLKAYPIVYAIGDEYEIFVLTKSNGIISVLVEGVNYYEKNSGCLDSEKNYAKIRIKQSILDVQKTYSICFRKTIRRKAYFSEFEDIQMREFKFRPLEKLENIKAYHVADVHCNYDVALKTCSYFGDELDLLIVNGDMGEVETIDDYEKVVIFVGAIAKGSVPVVYARGNHDTRGRLAELFTEYFPSNEKNTYYTFQVGCLKGIVLDLGEDKVDDFQAEDGMSGATRYVYNGTNVFGDYRKKQLHFLENLSDTIGFDFVVCHIPPAKATDAAGSIFDIERDTYFNINKQLERLKIKFMISGHFHRAFILEKNDTRSFMPHDYTIIVGSEIKIVGADPRTKEYCGTALTINGNNTLVEFTDSEHRVVFSQKIKY